MGSGSVYFRVLVNPLAGNMGRFRVDAETLARWFPQLEGVVGGLESIHFTDVDGGSVVIIRDEEDG